jgi:alpha-mannosidase
MNLFVKATQLPETRTIIGGFGRDTDSPKEGTSRYFAVFDGNIHFWTANRDLRTRSPFEVGRWQMFTATYNGKTLSLYKDGNPIAKRDVELSDDAEANVNIGTPDPWEHERSFHGEVQDFSIRRGAFTTAEVKQLFAHTKPVQ